MFDESKFMADTFTQIHLHCVFAVKHRAALISDSWRKQLHQYITGIIQNRGHKMLRINTMADHLHMLIGMRPNESLSGLICLLKSETSHWINSCGFSKTIFRWQEGYAAFSHSKNDIPAISDYIEYQQLHHKSKSFLEEYRQVLQDLGIEFKEKFIFQELN
jgi:putative transposase